MRYYIMRYTMWLWRPHDMYLIERIKAKCSHFTSVHPDNCHNPHSTPHLFYDKRVWSANEFLWSSINHSNESQPAKIISYFYHKETIRHLEQDSWNILASPSPTLIWILFSFMCFICLLFPATLFYLLHSALQNSHRPFHAPILLS